jgi:hypothetical protein
VLLESATGPRREVFVVVMRELEAGGALSGQRDHVAELLLVAIDEVGRRVDVESTRLLQGDGSLEDLRSAAARLDALAGLLAGIAP